MSPVLLTEVRLLITANENNNQTHAHGRHLNHGGGACSSDNDDNPSTVNKTWLCDAVWQSIEDNGILIVDFSKDGTFYMYEESFVGKGTDEGYGRYKISGNKIILTVKWDNDYQTNVFTYVIKSLTKTNMVVEIEGEDDFIKFHAT